MKHPLRTALLVAASVIVLTTGTFLFYLSLLKQVETKKYTLGRAVDGFLALSPARTS